MGVGKLLSQTTFGLFRSIFITEVDLNASGCRPELISPHCSMLRRLSADGSRIAPQALQQPALASHAANSTIRRHEHLGGPRGSCEPRQRTCHCCSPSNVGQPSYRCRSTQRGSFDVAEWSASSRDRVRCPSTTPHCPSIAVVAPQLVPNQPAAASGGCSKGTEVACFLAQRLLTSLLEMLIRPTEAANTVAQMGQASAAHQGFCRLFHSSRSLAKSRIRFPHGGDTNLQPSLRPLVRSPEAPDVPKPSSLAVAKRQPNERSWRTKIVSRPALAHANFTHAESGVPGCRDPRLSQCPPVGLREQAWPLAAGMVSPCLWLQEHATRGH